jgi:hypothetical protein
MLINGGWQSLMIGIINRVRKIITATTLKGSHEWNEQIDHGLIEIFPANKDRRLVCLLHAIDLYIFSPGLMRC